MKIEAYSFGKIVIGGTKYTSDLIILPQRIVPGWWRMSGHLLVSGDIRKYISEEITDLLVGAGYMNMMKTDTSVYSFAREHKITVTAVSTRKIADMYNSHPRKSGLMAALHLTC